MRYLAVALVASLTACTTPQQRLQAAINEYGPPCESMGMARGSENWQQCILTLYQQDRADSAQRDAALSATGIAILNANKPAPRLTTSCRWVGPNWVCS